MITTKENHIDILTIGDPILNTVASEITDITTPAIQKLISDMFDTMYHKERGIGLAAPQIGVSKRLIVMDIAKTRYVLINPEYASQSDEMVLFTEGCLSVPQKELPIIRHEKVVLKYYTEKGLKRTLKAQGLLAIACQHEIDHLDGILITDRYQLQANLRQQFNIML